MVAIAGLPSRYRIERLIGEGGFGKVYRVFDSQLDQVIALKVLSQERTSVRTSLMKEFKVLAHLQHPNLVRVFDFGTLESRLFYFTMEYIAGENLRLFFKDKPNLRMAPYIIEQLLAALSYLHKNGVIHGDIKPENILITGKETPPQAKLLDFGLMASSGAQRGERVSGTPRFLAPEILRAGAHKNPATDLYALGAALVESIEDKDFPAAVELTEDQLKQRYVGVRKALAEAGVKNPSSLASFILDLCDVEPLERPASMALFSDHEREDTFRPVFTGRKKELGEISRFLHSQQAVQKVLVLHGPRGIGKKSIIRKAMQAEQLKQRLCIDLSTISHDIFSPNKLVSIMASQVGSSEREILLGKASAISSSSRSLKKATETHTMGQRSLVLFNHIIDGLQEIASRRAIILSLPDIDRLGQEYLRFLNQILNHMDLADFNFKVLLSLNTDVQLSENASQIVDRLSASERAALLNIEGFSDQMLTEYFTGAFGASLLSDNERRNLLERTKGIPLVIETAARHMISQGIIRFETGKWAFDRTLFATRGLLIGSDKTFELAFGDLNPNERKLLELLAVLNHEISRDGLEDLAKGLIPSWELGKKQLIDEAILTESPSGTISFAHPQYRESILENCSVSRIKDLNRHIAECLSVKEPSEALRITRHFVAAKDLDSTIKHARDIMSKLYSTYMPYDCLRLFTNLRDLARRSGNRTQLVQANAWLAPLEAQAGLLNEAIEAYSMLINDEEKDYDKAQHMMMQAILFDKIGDGEKAFTSMRRAQHFIQRHGLKSLMGHTYYHLGNFSMRRSIYYLERALGLFKNRDRNMYLMTLAQLCHRYSLAGNIMELRSCSKGLLSNIGEADDNANKEIYSALLAIHFYTGDYEAQRMYIEKKMAIQKKQDDMQGMVESLNNLGGYYYVRGDYSQMAGTLKEAYSLSVRYNQMATAMLAGSNLILAYRMLGDYGKSLRTLYNIDQLFRERSISGMGSLYYLKPMQLFVLLGKTTEAGFFPRAKIFHREAKKSNNAISFGHYHMCYSTHHHLNLRYKRALSSADKALALFKKAEDRDDIALAHIQKSILLASIGELKDAARNIKQATKIYDAIHCEYLKPLLMLGRGMVARCAGGDDARQLLAEGLRTSKKMGTREYTWQLQRELALYHRDRSEVRKALGHFQDAIETLKQITETLDEEKLKVSYLETPLRKRIFDEIKELKNKIQ